MFFSKLLPFAAVASLSLSFFPSVSRAEGPSAQDSCEIIHRYEGLCGNSEPDTCVRHRSGIDYWNNAEHRAAWDAYFNLCGQDATRDAHECVAYLGISSQCTPSVEAALPLNVRYEQPMQYQVAQPQPQLAVAYQQPVQYQVVQAEPELAVAYRQPMEYAVLQPEPELAVAYNPPMEYAVLQPQPLAVAYREPIQYQVCCQAQQPSTGPVTGPVDGPVVQVPGDSPAVPSQPGNPVIATPTPEAVPTLQPSIPESPEGPVAEDEDSSDRDPISGKVSNGNGGNFQMSGTGCSFQGQAGTDLEAGFWLVLAGAFALLGRKRNPRIIS